MRRSQIYRNNPQINEALKAEIISVISEIQHEPSEKIIQNSHKKSNTAEILEVSVQNLCI